MVALCESHPPLLIYITSSQNTSLKYLKLVAFCFCFRSHAFDFIQNNTLLGWHVKSLQDLQSDLEWLQLGSKVASGGSIKSHFYCAAVVEYFHTFHEQLREHDTILVTNALLSFPLHSNQNNTWSVRLQNHQHQQNVAIFIFTIFSMGEFIQKRWRSMKIINEIVRIQQIHRSIIVSSWLASVWSLIGRRDVISEADETKWVNVCDRCSTRASLNCCCIFFASF